MTKSPFVAWEWTPAPDNWVKHWLVFNQESREALVAIEVFGCLGSFTEDILHRDLEWQDKDNGFTLPEEEV